MKRPAIAWTGLGSALVLLIVGGVFTAAGDGDLTEVAAGFVLVLPFASVGALVSARQSGNAIGWLLLGIGLCLALAGACDGAIQYGLDHPGAIADLGILALVSAAAFSGFFVLLFLVLLLLPNGRLVTRRWRIVVGGVALLGAIDLCLVVRSGPFDDWKKEGIRNPLGVAALHAVTSALYQVAILLSFALLLASLGSIVVRFRRSTGVERLQLRWIVTAVVATGLTWVAMIVASLMLGDRRAVDYFWGAAILSISFIPVGIGVAVMRYRLYEIDRVISKTLVYAALTRRSRRGVRRARPCRSDALLVVRGRLEPRDRGVDARRRRSLPPRALARAAHRRPTLQQAPLRRRSGRSRAFGARLREQIDLGTLEHDLQGVVTETMQPAHASVWLRKAWL